MLTSAVEIARRAATLATGHIRTLPVLALNVHSACNCRCVMCDIWKANADKREISEGELARHLDSIRRLHVQRIMLTGGEPLLHANLWRLCERLRAEDIQLTLVTTGLLIDAHAAPIADLIDHVVVSIDGAPETHDAIRRVRGGFARIATGIEALRARATHPRLTARSVVQKINFRELDRTVQAVEQIGVDALSFLAADVSSTAFNRPVAWTLERRQEVGLAAEDLPELASSIERANDSCRAAFESRFVEGGIASLWHIHDHYAASASVGPWPAARCNAPWVSAVVEADGAVRPCFFHPAYESVAADLEGIINSPQAVRFRQTLDVQANDTCRRCVCRFSLPLTRVI